MVKKTEYYKRLDYLRIISCIMVLLYHLGLLKGGFLAVCTFFSLSGYLDCLTALKKEKFSIKEYYLNRLKKIYLPLLLVVFITIMFFKLNEFTNWMNLKPETFSVLFGYNNFWQLNANLDYFTKNINSPFMHFWYIAILMQFELIFPIAFKLINNIKQKVKKDISTIIVVGLAILTTIIFIIMSITQEKMAVYYNTFARSFSILFGVLLALIHYKYNLKISRAFKKINSIIYLLYNVALIGLCIFVTDKSNNYAVFMILATIISIRIIEYSTEKQAQREKNNKIIDFLAKQSYGIYLVQYPVIFFIQGIEIPEFIKIPLIIALTFIGSYLLSLLLKKQTKPGLKKGNIIIFCIIIIGTSVLIFQKDHSEEMKELENLLSQNQKISEEKNNEILTSEGVETKEGASNQSNQQENQQTNNEKDNKQEEIVSTVENLEKSKEKIEETVKQLPIVGVGDSVLLGVSDELRKIFPNVYIDGKVSRTISGGKDVLQSLKNQGKLSNTLVLALANNGDYSDKRCKDLMEVVGDREIYWVNAVGADDPKYNERFKQFASNYPNIHIVEWDIAAKGHPEYFYADGVHLKGNGPKAYANTVYEAIYNNYLNKIAKE